MKNKGGAYSCRSPPPESRSNREVEVGPSRQFFPSADELEEQLIDRRSWRRIGRTPPVLELAWRSRSNN